MNNHVHSSALFAKKRLSIHSIKSFLHQISSYYVTYPKKYAFFVSQKSLTPACGNISFCKISRAYLIRFSLVTPGLAPRAPIKLRATFCSCITKASSRDGFTWKRNGSYEQHHEKTINVVSKQIRHKPACTAIEYGGGGKFWI